MPDETVNRPDDREEIAHLEMKLGLVRTLLDLLPHYMYIIDRNGRYRMANKAAAQELGETPDSILSKRFQDVASDRNQAEIIMEAANRTMDAGLPKVTPNTTLQRDDGSSIVMQLHEVPFKDPQTGEDWLLGIATNTTAEAELAHARIEKARVERELSIARSIQESLLPTESPACTAFAIEGWSRPADETGGDFYDWFRTPDGTTYAVLGDVTGHGVGPALIAATSRAYARALFTGERPMHEVMTTLNRMLARELPPTIFVTLAIAEVPCSGRTLRLLSAGHGPTFFRPHAGPEVRTLESHGPPLGVLEDAAFDHPTELECADQSVLLLASDGFAERFNAQGDQLGNDAVRQRVSQHTGGAGALLESLVRTTDAFAGDEPQSDDMTAVAIMPR